MSLNELIAQGAQFKAPDLLGQYAAVQGLQHGMQQNALNTMKMDEMRRSMYEQEGMRNYLRSNPNLMDPAVQTQMMAYGKPGQEAVSTAAKARQDAASARSSETTANEKEFAQFTRGARTVNSEEGVAQYVAAMYSHPTISPLAKSIKPFDQSLRENLELFRKDPLTWQVSASSVPFDKVMELSKGTRQNVDTGGGVQGQTVDYRGQVVPGSVTSTPKTMPPGTAEANETARGNLRVNEGRLKIAQDAATNKVSVADTKKQEATGQLDDIVASLNAQYDALEKGGGIVSTDKGTLSNLAASAEASGLGQYVGKALGTQNQSARNQIGMTRPQLLMAIKNASGMTAKQLDSNADLKLWLQAATDPQLDVQANRAALNNIVNFIGKRSAAPAATTPTSKTAAPPASEMAEALRWAKANPNDEDAKRIIREFGGR